ncbi:MAG: DUF6398 domain-containing protein [bacterium]
MAKEEKTERHNEIKAAVKSFCDTHLNEELGGYAQKLCDKLGRKRTLSITSGRPEIWSAAIIYVIARLNFLFDQSQKHYISADTICDFFGVKKSTASQKATLIEKTCKIRTGEPEPCSERFSDMFTLVYHFINSLTYFQRRSLPGLRRAIAAFISDSQGGVHTPHSKALRAEYVRVFTK